MKWFLRLVSEFVKKIRKEGADYPHFFWHSEMEDRGGCDRCPIWSGRAHLYLTDRKVFSWEWRWFTLRNRTLGTSLSLWDDDGNDGTTLSIKIPWLCNLYFGTEGFLAPRYEDISEPIEFRAEYHLDHAQLGVLSLAWNKGENWGERVSGWAKWIDVADVLLGRCRYESKVLRQESGSFWFKWNGQREEYDATFKVERCVWTRPRDPLKIFYKERLSVRFDIPGGIPEPGKGENSWDCGNDATFGAGATVQDVSDAEIDRAWASVVDRVTDTRIRRGGAEWVLQPKQAAQ